MSLGLRVRPVSSPLVLLFWMPLPSCLLICMGSMNPVYVPHTGVDVIIGKRDEPAFLPFFWAPETRSVMRGWPSGRWRTRGSWTSRPPKPVELEDWTGFRSFESSAKFWKWCWPVIFVWFPLSAFTVLFPQLWRNDWSSTYLSTSLFKSFDASSQGIEVVRRDWCLLAAGQKRC